MQEDIIGITDENFNKIVEYEYDSWGNIITIKDNNGNIITDESHIGIINPFRYRSYYYDKETKLYYLNSRYYNPEWGRFINADNYINTKQGMHSLNMYSYTENNYINRSDSNGVFWFTVFRGLFYGSISGFMTLLGSNNTGKKLIEEVLSSFLGGMFAGVVSSTPLNFLKIGNVNLGNMIKNYGCAFLSSLFNGDNLGNILFNTAINGTIGNSINDVFYIGETWIRPDKLSTSITGNYQRKMTINDFYSGARSFQMNKTQNLKEMYDNYIEEQKNKEDMRVGMSHGVLPSVTDGFLKGAAV